MRGYIEIDSYQPVEEFILDLLEELDVIDEYHNYSLSIPPVFRLRFDPLPRLVRQDGFGSRVNPVDLTGEFDSA
jgi:hypothetical protein